MGDECVASVWQVKGCLNKVSEANLPSIVEAMCQTFASHPQTEVHKHLAETVLELAGEGSGRIIEQFAALYAVFVAALHTSVGLRCVICSALLLCTEFGTHTVQRH